MRRGSGKSAACEDTPKPDRMTTRKLGSAASVLVPVSSNPPVGRPWVAAALPAAAASLQGMIMRTSPAATFTVIL